MKSERIEKKIFLNEKKTKWCRCIVFKNKVDMQDFYKNEIPDDVGHYKTEGVSIHYERYVQNKLSGETGKVLLHFYSCSAPTTTHELLHAVLYAYKHKKNKVQYPIIIKGIKEEEEILHNLSFAVNQFYKWYWKKVAPKFNG